MNMRWWLQSMAAVGFLMAGPLQAAVVCTGPGEPSGCVQVEPAPAPVNSRPVVDRGAPGVGVRPAAGPGVGPNAGGPVNRPGYR